MPHKAQALVQTCIDFRFRKALNNFITEELKLDSVDLKTDGGGVKMIVEGGPIREWLFANYKIAFDLHSVNRLILINHQDCGAYGGTKSFESLEMELKNHESQLKNAVQIIQDTFPSKQIEAYIALISPEEQVTFKKIV